MAEFLHRISQHEKSWQKIYANVFFDFASGSNSESAELPTLPILDFSTKPVGPLVRFRKSLCIDDRLCRINRKPADSSEEVEDLNRNQRVNPRTPFLETLSHDERHISIPLSLPKAFMAPVTTPVCLPPISKQTA